MTFTFGKRARILSKGHFDQIQKTGQKLVGQTVIVCFRKGRASRPKLGITASRRYGKAHERNRFKRVVREAFRLSCPTMPNDLELNVIPRKSDVRVTLAAILKDFSQFLYQLRTDEASKLKPSAAKGS